MQEAENTVSSNEYRSVPIGILVESATNPRKRFDEKNLEELAASMKAQGILAPLLVRELDESKYEVVAGARRLRAAKLAELETVPVRVVKLTDVESIEAQVIENLQREDTYDEAELCKLLLEFSLLDSAYQRSTTSREDVLMDAAKRYRVDTEKLQKAVAKEFATKRDKKRIKPKIRKAAA